MSIVHVTTHADQMVDLLLQQFKGKVNWEALLRAWAINIQGVEDMLYDLFTKRSIDTAYGRQLDILGGIVGEARSNRLDEAYRIAIKTRVIRNVSSGTPDSILEAFALLTNGTDVTFTYNESYPAEVDVKFSGPSGLPTVTALAYGDVLANLVPAGVGYNLVWPPASATQMFRFSLNDSLVEQSGTVGFGTTASGSVGGHLAGVIGAL